MYVKKNKPTDFNKALQHGCRDISILGFKNVK